MNLKKNLVKIITIILFAIFVIAQMKGVYAQTQDPSICMGITALMTECTPNMGYSIKKPGETGASKIWNIVKYPSGSGENYQEADIYCVRAGQGFSNVSAQGNQKQNYDCYYDMLTERDDISSKNTVLHNLVEGQQLSNETNTYNALLALLDRLYLPEKDEDDVKRKELILKIIKLSAMDEDYREYYNTHFESMAEAFNLEDDDEVNDLINKDSAAEYELTDYALTEDDIIAVQQAAIWYFTNYDENTKYDMTGNHHSWLYYSTSGTNETYNSLSNYHPHTGIQVQNDVGQIRTYQAEILYNYLIREAKAHANEYEESSSELDTPIKINEETLTRQIDSTDGQYYIVGPFNIEKLNSKDYTINLEVKNGDDAIEYTLLQGDKKTTETSLKNLVGQGDFYIKIQESENENLTVTINANYSKKSMKLWASSQNDQAQPLVELDETDKTITKTLTLEPEKIRDLALRKYITAVEGSEFTQQPRIPTITDTNKLKGINALNHTATYKHRKDPVQVKKDDIITYTIKVYNEGNVKGRAKQIIDQLPTGLEYVEGSVSGDYEVQEGGYDKSLNKITLTKKDNNNLDAYSGSGDPSSNTVTINCKVTATAPTSNSKQVLTNIAYISDDEFEEDGDDIDSKPTESPTKTASQLVNENENNYKGNTENPNVSANNNYWKGQQDDDDFEKVVILPEKIADLALRKYITNITGSNFTQGPRTPIIEDKNKIGENKNIGDHTATYKHRKDPVQVKKDDIITYTIKVYNEGTLAGRATQIIDQLPTGLEYVEGSVEGDYTASYDKATNKITFTKITEDNLAAYTGSGDPSSNTVTVKCKVTAEATTNKQVLTNIAYISDDEFAEEATDIDSQPTEFPAKTASQLVNEDENDYKGDTENPNVSSENNYWKGQQDDDDFEKVVIPAEEPKPFDLKLIKRITEINGKAQTERIENIDTSNLNTEKEDSDTTAQYELNKDPLLVKAGDVVKYTFRIYNEGYVDGYASKITEDIPEGLEFLWSEKTTDSELKAEGYTTEEIKAIKYNQDIGWTYDDETELKDISTDYLSKDRESALEIGSNLIKAFGANPDGTKEFTEENYKEVSVYFRVKDNVPTGEVLRNEAAITEDTDANKGEVTDRDSKPEDWVGKEDHDNYEDDEDYDNVVLGEFDLALRKFITKIENREVDSRIPQVSYDEENNKIKYEHGKDPLTVANGYTVEYTIRVFNEGDINGYAAQVLDDIPDGLEFLPENETNTEYRWKMYKKLDENENTEDIEGNIIVQDGEQYVETKKAEEAEIIVTDYLSKEQGETRIKNSQEDTENPNLLKAFDKSAEISNTNPDYKDVKVAFKVTEPNSSSKVIVNSAQISEDTDENGNEVDDKDSTPGEWNDGEDDQDKEYVELKEFDLALRKWVTQAIVIDNGKQTITQTGHDPYDDPEQIVKVEIVHSKLNTVTVKFRYSIRVINQGDIEGYAKEITDYVPQGLKFVAADNPGWTDEGNNVISTRLLENTLLKPGEYADVEVVLTWINNENGLGTVLTNKAEISEDDNPYDIPDRDSTPDNKKEGEDDIDDAPVMLSIKTGREKIYLSLGFTTLSTIASGIILIKKYVL